MKRILLFALFFSMCSDTLFAQAITINARIDSTQILIGDQIWYTIELSKPVREDIRFPLLKDSMGTDIEIIETVPPDTVFAQGNQHTLRMRYLITSFDTGMHILPRQPFLWNRGGNTDTLFSNDVMFRVDLVAIDTTQNTIKDIKAPYEAPFTWEELIPYILWGLLIAALVAAAIYVIWRIAKKKPIIPVSEKPKIPAHIITLQQLDELKEKKLWQNNQVKKFHSEVTGIIRQYIENRFEIPALEQVSYEIINDCESNNDIPPASVQQLKQMLHLADLVKFAKWQPLPDENDTSLKNAYLFVESTIPGPQEDVTNESDPQEPVIKTEDHAERN